jgi:hypothetical protein
MRCLILPIWVVSVTAQPVVTVTLYDLIGLKPEIREGMKRETARIFLAPGLKVDWIECEVNRKPMNISECAVPLGPARVMLQIAPGLNKKMPKAAGWAVTQDKSCVFACIHPERVKELARDAKWDFDDLLGHVVAHELGHLLLCSSAHTHAGVMRARWETEDLRGLSHAGLVFLPGQLSNVQLRAHPTLRDRRQVRGK